MSSWIERLRNWIPREGFKSNFFALASGTSISQAIALLFMPLLTRLYDPDAFGRFGIYFAIISILGTLSTGRIELTMMLPKSEVEAKKLWRVSAYIVSILSVVFSVLVLATIILFRNHLKEGASLEMWGNITFGIFFIALAETLIQWHNRQKNYRTLGIKNIIERVTVISTSLLFAFAIWTHDGLIWAQNAAILSVVLFLFYKTRHSVPYSEPLEPGEFTGLIKRYRDFPLMQGWSAVLMKLGTQIPVLVLGTRFAMEQTGHVNLAYRIIEAPVSLLAVSFATTYYQYTSQMDRADLRKSFIKSVRLKSLFLLPIFMLAAALSPLLFARVFGADWYGSGLFAIPLVFLSFIKIIYVSQSVIFLVIRRVDLDFKISLGFLFAQVIGFYASVGLGWSALAAVCLMSLLSGIVFTIGLFVIYREISQTQSPSSGPLSTDRPVAL